MNQQIIHVVGARPNFMKAAPVIHAIDRILGKPQYLVHTGQHYDHKMSQVFFEELGIPKPDINLDVGSGSHAVQTGQVMARFETVVQEQKPAIVLVYGDVNSTVAAAMVCAKLGIPVGHVEAGLRSFDRTMPEEINRLLTDQIADLLLTPSVDGNENLSREGIPSEKIFFVGNVMIDTLVRLLPNALSRWSTLQSQYGLNQYGLVTLHRPGNVDQIDTLTKLVRALLDISRTLPLIFPIHPRTRQRLNKTGLDLSKYPNFQLIEPIGYLDFLALQKHATVVVTDSGGIQEETTYLGTPCLTMRPNTERPVTVEMGSNLLLGQSTVRLKAEIERVLAGQFKVSTIPPLWEGRASERIAQIIGSTFFG